MDVFKAMRLAQFLQALLSIFLFVYLIKICRLISPNTIVSLGAVIFTGILPVASPARSRTDFRGREPRQLAISPRFDSWRLRREIDSLRSELHQIEVRLHVRGGDYYRWD
jgi:hypothetical protein